MRALEAGTGSRRRAEFRRSRQWKELGRTLQSPELAL